MFILRTQEDVTQIGVGLIKKVQGNRCSSEACFDIIFYAPKGAKSQAGKKNDQTLSTAIFQWVWHSIFTLDQKVKKIEEEDTVLERDVMLAFNLTVTREGKFSVQKKRTFSLGSYDITANVVELFYRQKEQAYTHTYIYILWSI